ncbi:MAG: mechanosensitive ion channel family protein [Bacteroidales bacterium]|nr:MAG: mechanosensitive ion channel family protein [Bacteroidales bacterium]
MNAIKDIFQTNYVKYGIIIIAAFLVAFILSKILRALLKKFLQLASHKLKVETTQFNFLYNGISFVLFLCAFIFIFYSIPGLRALGVTLFAGAGVAAAIILLASQQAFSNIINGIFIIIFKPFKVGDVIKVGTLRVGKIEDITLRHTVIRDFENRRIIIPNTVIGSETLVNSSIKDELICNFVEFGISYDSDANKAIEIIREEAMKHPNYIDNRTKEEKKKDIHPVQIKVIGFGDSSVNLRAFVWTKDHSSGFILKCDLFKSVKQRFDKEGVEIPFPYRTIVFKKDIEH